MKQERGIAVQCSDGSSGTYRARCGLHTASATSNPGLAVRRCAAKALGLVSARHLEGETPSEYSARVAAAADRIRAYGQYGQGGDRIWTAYVLPERHAAGVSRRRREHNGGEA